MTVFSSNDFYISLFLWNEQNIYYFASKKTQKLEWSVMVIIESWVNQMLFVALPLNFWVILIDDSCCLIHPLDSITNITMGKSKEFSIDLKEHIIDLNKSGESLGTISKQL